MKSFRKLATILIYLLNIVFLIIPLGLEYFGKKKMMMHRFLLSKNTQFEAIFTNSNINLLRILFVAFIIIGAVLLIKKNTKVKYASILVILFSVLGLALTVNDFSLKAYYFMLISTMINSLLSILNLSLNIVSYKN